MSWWLKLISARTVRTCRFSCSYHTVPCSRSPFLTASSLPGSQPFDPGYHMWSLTYAGDCFCSVTLSLSAYPIHSAFCFLFFFNIIKFTMLSNNSFFSYWESSTTESMWDRDGRENFHLLALSKCSQQPRLDQTEAGSSELAQVPHMGALDTNISAVTCCLAGYALAGSWNRSGGGKIHVL